MNPIMATPAYPNHIRRIVWASTGRAFDYLVTVAAVSGTDATYFRFTYPAGAGFYCLNTLPTLPKALAPLPAHPV